MQNTTLHTMTDEYKPRFLSIGVNVSVFEKANNGLATVVLNLYSCHVQVGVVCRVKKREQGILRKVDTKEMYLSKLNCVSSRLAYLFKIQSYFVGIFLSILVPEKEKKYLPCSLSSSYSSNKGVGYPSNNM